MNNDSFLICIPQCLMRIGLVLFPFPADKFASIGGGSSAAARTGIESAS